MNIPSAKDAKIATVANALSKQEEAIARESAEIELRINKAIADGRRGITGSGRLSPQIQGELIDSGYVYTESTHHGEEYWLIYIP